MNLHWVILWIIPTISGNILFSSLENTTNLAKNLGPARLYHDMWKLFVAIDVSAIDGRLINLRKLYADAYKMCKGCLEEVELNLIHGRINRLEENKKILHQLMGKRHKRGLLNIFGTGFKTLFGTMDNNDLEYINGEMDKLYTDNTILAGTIQIKQQ